MKHLRDDEFASLALDEAGGVSIGGEAIGKLEGFRFVPDPRAADSEDGGIHGRTLRAAALKGLESEIAARGIALALADDAAITLSEHGKLWWDGAIVGKLVAGPSPLAPQVQVMADAHVKTEPLQARLRDWINARIAARLQPLLALRDAADARTGTPGALPGEARGVAHQLAENFAALDRAAVALPGKLGPVLRALRPFGVWVGRRTIYLPRLLRPDAGALLTLLWGIWTKKDFPPAAPDALVAARVELATIELPPEIAIGRRRGVVRLAEHAMVLTDDVLQVVAERPAEILVGGEDGSLGIKLDHGL